MKYIKLLLVVALIFFSACQSNKPNTSNAPAEKRNRVEQFCFIDSIEQENDKTTFVLDIIEYEKISDLDSTLVTMQIIELPNGFCYVNRKKDLERFEVSKTTKIILQTLSHKDDGSFNFNQTISLSKLIEISKTKKFNLLKLSPFKMVTESKKIILLKEIYLP